MAATDTGEANIVEGVYIFGGHDEYRKLCDRVRQGLLLPAHGVDPLEKYKLPADCVAEHPGRFAALLGMLGDEFANRPPAMDFLHPHRPPRRLGRTKTIAFTAAAILLLATLGGGFVWHNLSRVWRLNQELAAELQQLDGRVAPGGEDPPRGLGHPGLAGRRRRVARGIAGVFPAFSPRPRRTRASHANEFSAGRRRPDDPARPRARSLADCPLGICPAGPLSCRAKPADSNPAPARTRNTRTCSTLRSSSANARNKTT